MKRQFPTILSTLLLTAALRPAPVQAAVFERDWKTPGDGLLTYDDVNNREWLDLTESRLAMFPGATLEDRYQNSLLELNGGGLFEGFVAAKSADVNALAQSAGINTATLDDFPANVVPTTDLIDLVGHSRSDRTGGSLGSLGYINERGILITPVLYRKLARLAVVVSANGLFGQAGLSIQPGDADGLASAENTGVWLYRAVPEPSTGTIAYFCIALLWAGARPRRGGRRDIIAGPASELQRLQYG